MKKIIKNTLIFAISLFLAGQIWQNLNFSRGWETYLLVAVLLAVFEKFLKPIIKLLLLPINILTLGLFRSFINLFTLYLTVYFVPSFTVSPIHTNHLPLFGPASLSFGLFVSYLVLSITIYLIFSILRKILK